MNARRILLQGVVDIDNRLDWMKSDIDQFDGVLRDIAVLGNNDGNAFPDMPNFLDCQHGLIGDIDSVDRSPPLLGRDVLHARYRRDEGLNVPSGHHRDYFRQRHCPRHVDFADPCVRHRTAQERNIQHAWQRDIPDKSAIAGQQIPVFLARHRLADITRLAAVHRFSLTNGERPLASRQRPREPPG